MAKTVVRWLPKRFFGIAASRVRYKSLVTAIKTMAVMAGDG
jgi:hypothetical protein